MRRCFFLVLFYLPGMVYGQEPKLVLPVGHTSDIFSVVFSPDGQFLLTGSADNTAILWNLEGEQIHQFKGHKSVVIPVAFSPACPTGIDCPGGNGQFLLTGSWDNTAILWNLEGEEIQQFVGHTSYVNSVCFSPDGESILTGSSDSTAVLWNLEGKPIQRFTGHVGNVNSVCFSPDGESILTGSSDSTAFLWNLEGKPIQRFTGHTGAVSSVVFSPDGQSILTGSLDGTAIRWNIEGEQIHQFKGHKSEVSSVCFSPDGESILTGSEGMAILWNLQGKQIQQFIGNEFGALSVSFSPDGKYILTGSWYVPAIIWNLQGEQIHKLQRFKERRDATMWTAMVTSVAVSPSCPVGIDCPGGNGQSILMNHGGNAAIWDLTGARIQGFGAHNGLCEVVFSPDGQSILTGDGDRDSTVILWNLEGEQIQQFIGHKYRIESVAFSPDGKSILTGSADNTAILWNLEGEPIQRITGHSGVVFSVTFSPDGKSILTGSSDSTAILWNLEGEPIRRFLGHTSYVNSIAFSPDGQSILTGSLDSTAILWNLEGEPIQRFLGHTSSVESVAFSPACPAGIDCPGGNGQSILTGSADNTAILWNLEGEPIQRFLGHTSYVKSVAFLPACPASIDCPGENGQFILTGSLDHTTKIWNAKNGEELASLVNIRNQDWIVTTPSGLFDASPDAMTFMHYVVFYEGKYEVIELEQLKARYYEPGLLAKLIGFSKERIRPIEDFDAVALYPEVDAEIQGDALSIELKERNGGIGKVSIFINGKEVVEEANPLPRRENAQRPSSIRYDLKRHQNYLLQHPDSTNIISIRAYNEEGWLKSRGIHLDYKMPRASSRETGRSGTQPRSRRNQRPKLYVVSIGTSDYTGDEMDLQYADQDANSIAMALESVGSALFSNGDSLEIHCLTTAKADSTGLETSQIEWQYADKENIESTFKAIQQKAKAEDVIVVYLSGHGVARSGRDQTQFYYLTQGVASEESLNDPGTLNAYSISTEEFTTWINAIPALKQVLIIDACNSGQLVENITNKAVTLNSSQIRALDRMRDRTGMFLLSGSASDKVSYEASQYGQGLLTYALLQGMRGVAARKDREGRELIDVMNLFQYARDEVPRLAKSINGIQTPMLGFPRQGASFDIGILDDEAKDKIPIANKKPIIIRSNFMNELTFEDNLQLVQRLEQTFRTESRKGADAQMIYVDVNDYPGGYALRGLYRVGTGEISIKLRLFRGKESRALDVPAMDTVEALVEEIKWEVETAIDEWEEE